MAWDGKINVLLIGGGMISQEVVLPTIFQQRRAGYVNDVAVSALNGKITAEVREAFPDEPMTLYPDPAKVDPKENFPDLYREAMGALGDHGLVVVATPDHFHTRMVIEAIESGNQVVCMKPLCLKVAEAHQIIATAQEHAAYVFTEYHKRKDRAVRALRHRFRNGELGEALYGHAWIEEPKYMPLDKFGLWCEKSSPFEYIGTHYADVYYYVTGLKPKRVVGFGQKKFLPKHNINAYDAIEAVIQWEDESALWIQTNWVCSDKNSAMTNQGLQFTGTQGEYWADHKYRNLHFLTDDKGFDQYNPNFFKAYDDWDDPSLPDYVGYGFESNSQGILDTVHLYKETEGLSPDEAKVKRAAIIAEWEKHNTRCLPSHALIGVAINEAVRLSVDEGSRFVAFDDKMVPVLK